jgi:uncharacterized membrane protein
LDGFALYERCDRKSQRSFFLKRGSQSGCCAASEKRPLIMSCPDCQKRGSRKALWIALLAVIAVGAVGLAELVGNDGSAHKRRGPDTGYETGRAPPS